MSAIPLVVLVLLISVAGWPQPQGPLALVSIFLPHLCLATFALLPFSLRNVRLRAALAALALGCGIWLGSAWVSRPAAPTAGTPIRVLTWNVGRRAEHTMAPLLDRLVAEDADVVAIQELRPALAHLLATDTRITSRWPTQFLVPDTGPGGLALLTRVPQTEQERVESPVMLHARILVGERAVHLVTAHPYPARISLIGKVLPVGYDASRRDADLATVRAEMDTWAGDSPTLLLGDFNLAPTEAGNAVLVRGLADAHAMVGFGPGWTWRPTLLMPTRFGLIRIDRVLSGGGLRPEQTAVQCDTTGDHCAVTATLRLGADGPDF